MHRDRWSQQVFQKMKAILSGFQKPLSEDTMRRTLTIKQQAQMHPADWQFWAAWWSALIRENTVCICRILIGKLRPLHQSQWVRSIFSLFLHFEGETWVVVGELGFSIALSLQVRAKAEHPSQEESQGQRKTKEITSSWREGGEGWRK